MQTIEFKKGESSNTRNLVSAISRFIETGYHRDAKDFEADLRRLEEMRGEAMVPMVTPSFLQKLRRYFGELEQMASKFPFDDDNLKVAFGWTNFAGKDTKPVASFDIRFEAAAILFNMAVLNGKLGNQEGRGSPDKLRKACNYFLTAAGLLQFINERYTSALVLPIGADLREPVLMALKQLLVAQAQECFILKGIQDKSIRDGMLSKLASSAAALYGEAFDLASREKEIFGQSWLYHCQVKQSYFKALANSRKAAECLAAGQYGMEVALLQIADGHVREAKALLDTANKASKDTSKHLAPELTADIVALMAQNSKHLERARKDNDIIYHETVPGADAVVEIGAAVVANPIAFDPVGESSEQQVHLFESLSPYSLHRVVFSFLQRRDQIVNEITSSLSIKRQQLDSVLAGMNLPAALDAREAPQGLPLSILEKSEDVKAQGGSESLYSSKKTVQSLRGECLDVVEAVERMLDEEAAEDSAMAARFKDQWKRQPSSQLSSSFKERLAALKKTLDAAGESDELVSSRFEEYIVAILSLCSDREDLEASIPACRPENMPPVNYHAINNLRGLLEEGNQLNARAAELMGEVKALGEVLLDPSSGTLNETETELALARFDPFRSACEDLVRQYDSHMASLRQAFDTFSDRSHLEASLQERTSALRSLEEAHSHFSTLSSNFFEGIQFYTRCLESLQGLQGDLYGWREGRRFEGEEMRVALAAIEEEQARKARAEMAEREAKERAEREKAEQEAREKREAAEREAEKQRAAATAAIPSSGYAPYGYNGQQMPPQAQQPYGHPSFPYTGQYNGVPPPQAPQAYPSSAQYGNQYAPPPQPHSQPTPYNSQQYGKTPSTASSYQQPSPGTQQQQQQPSYGSGPYQPQQPPATPSSYYPQQPGQQPQQQQYGQQQPSAYGQPAYLQQLGYAQQPSHPHQQPPPQQQQQQPVPYGSAPYHQAAGQNRPGQWSPNIPVQYAASPAGHIPPTTSAGGPPVQPSGQPQQPPHPQGYYPGQTNNPNYRPPY